MRKKRWKDPVKNREVKPETTLASEFRVKQVESDPPGLKPALILLALYGG